MNKSLSLFLTSLALFATSSCTKLSSSHELIGTKPGKNKNQVSLNFKDNTLTLSFVDRDNPILSDTTKHFGKIIYDGDTRLSIVDSNKHEIYSLYSDSGRTCGLMFGLQDKSLKAISHNKENGYVLVSVSSDHPDKVPGFHYNK